MRQSVMAALDGKMVQWGYTEDDEWVIEPTVRQTPVPAVEFHWDALCVARDRNVRWVRVEPLFNKDNTPTRYIFLADIARDGRQFKRRNDMWLFYPLKWLLPVKVKYEQLPLF